MNKCIIQFIESHTHGQISTWQLFVCVKIWLSQCRQYFFIVTLIAQVAWLIWIALVGNLGSIVEIQSQQITPHHKTHLSLQIKLMQVILSDHQRNGQRYKWSLDTISNSYNWFSFYQNVIHVDLIFPTTPVPAPKYKSGLPCLMTVIQNNKQYENIYQSHWYLIGIQIVNIIHDKLTTDLHTTWFISYLYLTRVQVFHVYSVLNFISKTTCILTLVNHPHFADHLLSHTCWYLYMLSEMSVLRSGPTGGQKGSCYTSKHVKNKEKCRQPSSLNKSIMILLYSIKQQK